MTLEDLAQTLPNGFHDSMVRSIFVDYAQRQVTMQLAVWIGDMDGDEVARELRREGSLVLEGLQFMSMDAPDARYPFAKGDTLWVDLCSPNTAALLAGKQCIASGGFVSAFFVNEWNSFIHVAARAARLEWTTESEGFA